MISTNLALRFLLELSGLAALAYAGFHATHGPARWALAIAAPVALAIFWALVVLNQVLLAMLPEGALNPELAR